MKKGTTVAFWNAIVKPMGERSHTDFRNAIAADKRPVDLARHKSVWLARQRAANTNVAVVRKAVVS